VRSERNEKGWARPGGNDEAEASFDLYHWAIGSRMVIIAEIPAVPVQQIEGIDDELVLPATTYRRRQTIEVWHAGAGEAQLGIDHRAAAGNGSQRCGECRQAYDATAAVKQKMAAFLDDCRR
jgi:hypothetical protein